MMLFLNSVVNCFSRNPYGFGYSLSTENALVHFLNGINTAINSTVGVLYYLLIIAKAFGTVDHVIFPDKLWKVGFLIEWLKSNLINCKQLV